MKRAFVNMCLSLRQFVLFLKMYFKKYLMGFYRSHQADARYEISSNMKLTFTDINTIWQGKFGRH